nr:MAG TPA: hypothetical protein [Caudoviricetes sp.]
MRLASINYFLKQQDNLSLSSRGGNISAPGFLI